MALPTGSGEQKSLGLALTEIFSRAASIKQLALDKKARLASQNVAGVEIFDMCSELVDARAYMAARASTPGLAAYAQEIFNDVLLDIVAEYTAMTTTLDAVIAAIDGQTPSQLAAATYTPGATATFRDQLQALADSID